MDNSMDIYSVKYKKRFNYIKHIFFDENKLNCKGAKFQVIKFKKGGYEKEHFHNKTTEIFFTLDGQGIININGTMNTCMFGDIVLCEPNDMHSFKALEDWTIAIFKTNETKDDIIWKQSCINCKKKTEGKKLFCSRRCYEEFNNYIEDSE